MKNSLITGLLITAFSTSYLHPVNASTVEPQPEFSQSTIQNVSLNNTLSNSIRLLGAQTPLIQAYGLVILQQPDVNIEAMPSLTNHQDFAKINAREWIDQYNPKLLDLNEEIMRFSSRYNSYYNKLVELANDMNEDPIAKSNFGNAFDKLQAQVQMIQDNMEFTSLELSRYKMLLDQDSINFTERADDAIQSLQGSGGDLAVIREDIKGIQEEIQAELLTILNRPQEIINGSINIGRQVFSITSAGATTKTIDFVSIENLSDDLINLADSQVSAAALNIQEKQNELIPLIQQLSETEIQATQITLIEDQVDGFTDMIDRQLMIYEFLLSDWKALNESMIEMKSVINAEGEVDISELQANLSHLQKMSDEMNIQTNQFEDYVTNVNIQ
ncbi:HBL/NHE enterotoxin family protein [Bacillus spongiae]|uniref:HBL/NHE enterotoxin family protein n=1 Tax=Bacillus spongiae TaxID=2683610 RepID=A0ABU8HFA9_9BACI